MSTVFGDKIGITAATPGGSSGTWGTEYGTAFTLVDELAYASREDRNLVVVGGGKFGWDGTDLTFTASIEFRNHVTAYKISLTTAASPITLNAAHKVAYIQLTRKPGSDSNVTSATVVAAGSLPNGTTDADMGTFVVAYLTSDSTVYLPWAKKELLAGDSWAFGSGLTRLEELATQQVSFQAVVSDTSQVKVASSAAAPTPLWINGKLYVNTSDATMDLDTSGRSGLDTGAKAANTTYYLYAIPASSGRTFDIIASVTAPTTGPTGFTSAFKFIGVFTTTTSSAVDYFASPKDLEYFKQKALQRKPGHQSVDADTSQLIVPASKNKPACVIIDGQAYFNITDETCDLDTAGRGGLDTGTKAADTVYYLYAIPATTGYGFDLVCSVTAPSTGPTGFNSWTYLGGFLTTTSSAILEYVSFGGRLSFSNSSTGAQVTVSNASPATAKTLLVPTTAFEVQLRSIWSAVNAAGDQLVIGATSGDTTGRHRASTTTAGNNAFAIFWCPILETQTVYANVTTATTDSTTVRVLGWTESVMEWR